METVDYSNVVHIGRKIERVRRLRGMTQTNLGEILGITKQAISKMEQTEKIDDDRVKQIAEALGVTEDGLRNYSEEKILYNTINFYENSGVNSASISAYTETTNNFPIEKIIKLFEKLLKNEREKFEKIKNEKE